MEQSASTARGVRLLSAHVVLGLLFGVVSSLAFIGVREVLEHNATPVFDITILRWLYAHQTPGLFELAKGLAFLGSPLMMISLTVIGTLIGFAWRRVRGAAWTLPIAITGAGLLIQLLKVEFQRTRPAYYPHLLKESGYSFPSGHSLIAIVVYGLLGYFLMHLVHGRGARLAVRVGTVLLVVLIGVSRPYVQVHYPTDVLAGWAAGFPWLLTCIALHEALSRRFGRVGEPVLEAGPTNPVARAALKAGGTSA